MIGSTRRFVKPVMLFAVLVGVLAIGAAATVQRERRGVPVPKVASMAALRAQAPEDVAMARFFDAYGSEPLAPGRDVRRTRGLPPAPPPAGAAAPAYADFMRDLVCSSAAVVVGQASLERVLLNHRETFLFTRYTLDVERWIHPDREHGPSTIQLNVPGGAVEIGGRLTRTQESVHPEPGRSYVFLLERVPGSPGYSQLRRPIAEGTNWSDVVRDRPLPDALAQGAVGFSQLLEDLAHAGRGCAGVK